MPTTTPPYFFVHVMKTAGTTLYHHARYNFPGGLYPAPEEDDMHAGYNSIPKLLALPASRRDKVVMFAGHYPYVVTRLLGIDLVTLTLLRDPVDRTVSFLRQNQVMVERQRDLSLDEIYEDSFFFPTLIHNHQSKVFSMNEQDKLDTIYDVVEIDGDRLARAKANLVATNLVGLSEEFDQFLEALRTRYGWKTIAMKRFRESTQSSDASSSLRKRIADDNAADLELYEFARELCRHGPHHGDRDRLRT